MTTHKPVVDEAPHSWTKSGKTLDLSIESKDLFNALALMKAKEQKDRSASVVGRAERFTKFDFTCLVIARNLRTSSAVMSFAQKHGTVALQSFLNKNQRKLDEFLADARQWADAKRNADTESIADWDLVCLEAAKDCPFGASCSYKAASEQVFAANAGNFSKQKLAMSLREIIVGGPKKTCRVPFLIGPSNTGKSTLLYPFDKLFGPKQVHHKPALGATCGALRNLEKGKRFIFWDDFRPVEYASSRTVSTATFLSLFIGQPAEIQVSQAFVDGNVEVQWTRGAAFTAKSEDLWLPTSKVSAEDVQHMRNRVEEFRFTSVLHGIKDVEPCSVCMCRWITAGASEAVVAPDSGVAAANSEKDAPSSVQGFDDLMRAAKVSAHTAGALLRGVLGLGAVKVDELSVGDWSGLAEFKGAMKFEQQRLLAALRVPAPQPASVQIAPEDAAGDMQDAFGDMGIEAAGLLPEEDPFNHGGGLD